LELKDFVGNVDLSEEAVGDSNNWHTYLPFLQKILMEFEQHSRHSLLKLRLFDLVPQLSYRLRYMPIDTDALYDILKLATHPLVVGVSKTEFGDDARNKWGLIFDIAKYGDRFRCYIETDLVAVSISVSKPRTPTYTKRDWEIVDVTGKNVIGLVIHLQNCLHCLQMLLNYEINHLILLPGSRPEGSFHDVRCQRACHELLH